MAGNDHRWVPQCPACNQRALDVGEGFDEGVRERLVRVMGGRTMRCAVCRSTIPITPELKWLPA